MKTKKYVFTEIDKSSIIFTILCYSALLVHLGSQFMNPGTIR
jgi:hypothetical protein